MRMTRERRKKKREVERGRERQREVEREIMTAERKWREVAESGR